MTKYNITLNYINDLIKTYEYITDVGREDMSKQLEELKRDRDILNERYIQDELKNEEPKEALEIVSERFNALEKIFIEKIYPLGFPVF